MTCEYDRERAGVDDGSAVFSRKHIDNVGRLLVAYPSANEGCASAMRDDHSVRVSWLACKMAKSDANPLDSEREKVVQD
jgi:hypothetical protein